MISAKQRKAELTQPSVVKKTSQMRLESTLKAQAQKLRTLPKRSIFDRIDRESRF